jgi:hypothetical protein
VTESADACDFAPCPPTCVSSLSSSRALACPSRFFDFAQAGSLTSISLLLASSRLSIPYWQWHEHPHQPRRPPLSPSLGSAVS